MCVIIDANVWHHIYAAPAPSRYAEVVKWIRDRRGYLVIGGSRYGGQLPGEAKALVKEWSRSGLARVVLQATVDDEEQAVRNLGLCRSDDEHIIALARVSGSRILCSDDQDLHADFGNSRLISSPRGKVHPGDRHDFVMKRCRGCS